MTKQRYVAVLQEVMVVRPKTLSAGTFQHVPYTYELCKNMIYKNFEDKKQEIEEKFEKDKEGETSNIYK